MLSAGLGMAWNRYVLSCIDNYTKTTLNGSNIIKSLNGPGIFFAAFLGGLKIELIKNS